MKLVYRLALRTLLLLFPIMAVWGFFFYQAMIAEVVDETDDTLEDYSESIIRRALGGDRLPSISNGSNNQYYLTPISGEEAAAMPVISYKDSMTYIIEKGEKEPARIMRTIFVNDMGQHFMLTVATPIIDRQDLTRQIFYWVVMLYVVLLLTVVVVNTVIFYRSLKPLYVLLDWLDNYTVGKENAPLVNPTSVTEFQKLNDAAVKNALRHEQYNEQQKVFIGNASHEVQTPVAICLNRVEMMMEDDSLPENIMQGLAELHTTLQHISRLNRSLLLLTRIDNGQFSDVANIDLCAMARRYADSFADIYSHRGITCEMRGEKQMHIMINPTMAEMLVSNLLKNAFVHSPDGATVIVTVTGMTMDFSNVAESGPLDGEKVFERFYQGSKREGSTGLGLAICSAICRAYGLGIAYSYNDGTHHFTVRG